MPWERGCFSMERQMTSEQKALVRDSLQRLLPMSETAAELFYSRLFYLDPSLRHLFKVDIQEQASKFMEMIRLLASDLEQPDEFRAAVSELGLRHAGYGVKASNYNTVGEALIWAIDMSMGRQGTPELHAAWVEFYAVVSDQMKSAAEWAM